MHVVILIVLKEHPYYYQLQLQMKLFGVDCCDFVIWREDNIVRQRIPFDIKFISEALEKIPALVKLCILPELVGKYFTKPAKNSGDLSDSDVATTNGPTTDLEEAEDTLDDTHSVDDSQVVVVDNICSGDASLFSRSRRAW